MSAFAWETKGEGVTELRFRRGGGKIRPERERANEGEKKWSEKKLPKKEKIKKGGKTRSLSHTPQSLPERFFVAAT